MNRLFLSALAATTVLVGGVALAQAPGQPAPPPRDGHPLFAQMDANKDGVVTRAELNAALEKRFAALDTDKNGVISAAERETARKAEREERFNARFTAMDTDKNGQLSREELRAAHDGRDDHRGMEPGAGAPPPPPGGPGFDGGPRGRGGWGGWGHSGGFGDRGGFGKGPQGDVTKEQFMARPLRLFDVLDSNDDGKVTKAEMDAAHDGMRFKGPRRDTPPKN